LPLPSSPTRPLFSTCFSSSSSTTPPTTEIYTLSLHDALPILDLLYYLAGPIKRLKASVSQVLDYGIEVEDTVTASLEFENGAHGDRKSTRLNSSHVSISYAVFCLKKKITR